MKLAKYIIGKIKPLTRAQKIKKAAKKVNTQTPKEKILKEKKALKKAKLSKQAAGIVAGSALYFADLGKSDSKSTKKNTTGSTVKNVINRAVKSSKRK